MASTRTKFAALAILFLVSISMAHASIYRTIATTERSYESLKRCAVEVSKQPMQYCQRYMQEGEPGLAILGNDASQCCEQLSNLTDECKPTALFEMVLSEILRALQQQNRALLNFEEIGNIATRAATIRDECEVIKREK